MDTAKSSKPKNPLLNTRGLSPKQRKLIKARAEGKSLQEAGEIAGMSAKSAQQQACMELKKPEVAEAFSDLLNRACPDSFLADTYKEGMTATKVISAMVVAIDGEGMKDANSMTKDFVDVPDYPTRIKAADSVSKLKGYMVERKEIDLSEALMAAVAARLSGENANDSTKP